MLIIFVVKMIRNYQRSGSGNIDENLVSSVRANGNAINMLSAQIININSIISTLSGGTGSNEPSPSGDGKTLINPTQNSYLFTDPVIYSNPTTINGDLSHYPSGNTYMKGVTWMDFTPSNDHAEMDNCSVIGDLVFNNISQPILYQLTADNVLLSKCTEIVVHECSFNSLKCRSLGDMFNVESLTVYNVDCQCRNKGPMFVMFNEDIIDCGTFNAHSVYLNDCTATNLIVNAEEGELRRVKINGLAGTINSLSVFEENTLTVGGFYFSTFDDWGGNNIVRLQTNFTTSATI